MYCRFCGKEIKDQAKFCGFCGNPQDIVKAPIVKKQSNILNYVFGILFILGGILPYLLQGGMAEYEEYINYVLSLDTGYSSDTTLATAFCFRNFYNLLSPLFSFSSSALSVYVGLLLIKREQKLKLPLVFCFTVHTLSIFYTGVVNLLIYCAPKFVVSLFTPVPSIMEAAEELIRSEPDLPYYYQDQAIRRLIISIVLIALAVVLLALKKRSARSPVKDEKKSPCIGGILMILSISLLSAIGTGLSTSLISMYGEYALSAHSAAKESFSLTISPAVFFMFMILMAMGVIFTRTKRWILTLPTISVVALLALTACLFSTGILQEHDTPEVIYAMALRYFRSFIISNAAVLIAMFCWFSSVSRNSVPKWLQIALPVSIPILYIGSQIVAISVLPFNSGISFGILFISFLTIILSLLVRSKAPKTVI